MRDDGDTRDDDLDVEPVERRTSPRGGVQQMSVTVLDGGAVAGRTFSVLEAGPVSLFLQADEDAAFAPGQRYRIAIHVKDRQFTCETDCIRRETDPRRGVVLQLRPHELDAHIFLVEVLEPAVVPPGAH